MQRVFGNLDSLRYVDNRLDDERKAAFVAHLADDPHEAERVAMWSRQNDVIRATFAGIAVEPVPLWLRLGSVGTDRPAAREPSMGLDRRQPPGESRPAAPPRGPRLAEAPVLAMPAKARRRRTASIGVSAVVLFAIGFFVLVAAHTLLPTPTTDDSGPGRIDPPGLSALVARAADSYRTYALDPVRPAEMPATQQAGLDHWLQRRLTIPVHLPDLRGEGWTALGGRLVPGDLGPAAFYIYENDAGDRLGVYISRTAVTPTTVLALDPIGGGGAAMSWVAGQVGYVVTVDKSVDWLSRGAEALRARVARAGSE